MDLTRDKNYLISLAANKGHLNIVKYLIQNGSTISFWCVPAFVNAVSYGYFDIIKFLYENAPISKPVINASINVSAHKGYLNIIKYLHQICGGDLLNSGNSALNFAIEKNHFHVVDYIKKNTNLKIF